MWNTPQGDRRLTGAEAELVRQALAIMVDQLTDNLRCGSGEDELWDSGVTMYDELTSNQQLTVIKQVAEHLLRETPDTLELTAVNEAAAYAIFATAASQVEIEIDMAKDPLADDIESEWGDGLRPGWRTFWRQRVLDACRETVAVGEIQDEEQARGEDLDDDEPFELPSAESEDVALWQELIERLADRILWDRDFAMGESFLDSDPAHAALMKQMMGIESDYYTAIADEPSEEETAALLESIRRITHAE